MKNGKSEKVEWRFKKILRDEPCDKFCLDNILSSDLFKDFGGVFFREDLQNRFDIKRCEIAAEVPVPKCLSPLSILSSRFSHLGYRR